jgi:hypothetical protein
MNQITGITDNSKQIFKMMLDDGTIAQVNLNYLGATQRWAFDIIHPLLTVYNKILCTHPNILRQYKDIIPFGLMCFTNDGLDPVLVTDFKAGSRGNLYILTEADVAESETILKGLI